METSIVVGVIAAVASTVAAFVAWKQARIAADGARSVASLNHRVARLDTEADQLRDDYRALMEAVGAARDLSGIGRIMGAGEILAANPKASAAMVAAVDEVRLMMQVAVASAVQIRGQSASPLPDEVFEAARAALRESLDVIAVERAALLSG